MTNISQNIANQSPDVIASRLIQKAHNRDGLPEIFIGLAFLILGGLCWVQAVAPPRSAAFVAAVLGFIVLALLLGLGSPWAIKTVRRKFLVETVGFVEMKPVPRRRSIVVAAVALVIAVAALIAAWIGKGSTPPTAWVLAGTGIGGGALLILAGRLPRSVVSGVLMAATGIVLAFSGISLEPGFAILYGTIGLVLLVSGTAVLLTLICKPAERGE